LILRAGPYARPGTLFTDAGSTKQNILAALAGKLPASVKYVPAHPIAGSEKVGVEYARTDLFEGRVTIVIEEKSVADWDAFTLVGRFWASLGSRVISMPAEDHDRVLASTSHLPHAAASAVAGITPKDWLPLTAGGFRDVTRIAAGDPDLWAAIFEANRDCVLAAMAAFTDRLAEFRKLLEAGDHAGLVRWLTEGKQVRDALGS
jgi:prephenate dehydrogenase